MNYQTIWFCYFIPYAWLIDSLTSRFFTSWTLLYYTQPRTNVANLLLIYSIHWFNWLKNFWVFNKMIIVWFSTVCDPYLNVFRGLIPPLGGLDLSPILAFLVLNAFTSTAAALPAELPITEQSKQGLEASLQSTVVTSSQNKWMRRLQGTGSKTSTPAN
jgi:YggT family protein